MHWWEPTIPWLPYTRTMASSWVVSSRFINCTCPRRCGVGGSDASGFTTWRCRHGGERWRIELDVESLEASFWRGNKVHPRASTPGKLCTCLWSSRRVLISELLALTPEAGSSVAWTWNCTGLPSGETKIFFNRFRSFMFTYIIYIYIYIYIFSHI